MAFGHMSLAFDHMNLPPQGNKELEVFILILSGPVLFPTIQRAIKHMRSQEVPTNFSYNYLYSKLPSNSDHPRIMLFRQQKQVSVHMHSKALSMDGSI